MLAMLADADVWGLRTLTILYDLTSWRRCRRAAGSSGATSSTSRCSPREYRDSLDEAAAQATTQGVPLVAPCISNLDQDSLRWLERVRGSGWPPGVSAISCHRYGDGRFAGAHPGFDSRDDEVAALRALCDGLPFLVTEFGYKTKPGLTESSGGFVSEADQATYIGYEWTFWQGHGALAALLYQINDGLDVEIEGFGIRRCNPDGSLGDWKPSAYTLLSRGPSGT